MSTNTFYVLKSPLEMLRFFEFEVLLHKSILPQLHLLRRCINSATAPKEVMAAPRHQTPAGTLLPRSPALSEWQKSARLRASTPCRPITGPTRAALAGNPAPNVHTSGCPRLAGTSLAGVPAPQAQIFPKSPSS
jgi:hypothetical protein